MNSAPDALPAVAAAQPEGHRVAAAALRASPQQVALLAGVFVVAACGLLYELAAAALASYVLGDSVLQFSTIIGTYLFAMGLGSWASRYLEHQLPAHFLRIELLIALIGGCLPAVLLASQLWAPGAFRLLLYGLVLGVGALVGLEIPLVMRILKREVALRDLVSQVLTFDYLGALAVSLAFPLVLVPKLGLVRTGLLFGLLNAAVAVWALWLFRLELRRPREHALACAGVVGVLTLAWAGSTRLTQLGEDQFYQDPVVATETTPYQRIVLTHNPRLGHRLYLNGNLQFAESDEYRYHEALVHPAMAAHGGPRRVAVLGGGDGMAVREILKYPSVLSVTLVELDPAMTRLFSAHPALVKLNGRALLDPRVQVVNQDAFAWLDQAGEPLDLIVVDFPDPTNFNIGKLYSETFYQRLGRRLAATGFVVVQSTSPLVARHSFWTVVQTLEAAGFRTAPYHAHVPSFGEWGFVIGSLGRGWRMPQQLPEGLRFLNLQSLPLLFDFPQDMARVPTEVNRLSTQVLVHHYEREWGRVFGH